MKRKTVILIGALALTLSGCSGKVAVDSTTETSEIVESTEQVSETQSTEESQSDNNQSEELTVEESSEIVSEEEIEEEADAESGCLLPVSADSNGAFDIDLSEYPKLNKSIQEYQKQLEKHVANLERDTDKKVSVSSDLQRADTSVYSILRKSFT